MNSNKDKDIQEKLSERYPCFVLVTCEPPHADGNMNVEMSFEGDPVLAAMMLQGAQSHLESLSCKHD